MSLEPTPEKHQRWLSESEAQAASEAAKPTGVPLERALAFPDPVLGESPKEYCQRIIRSLWRLRNENAKARAALHVCIVAYRTTWPSA